MYSILLFTFCTTSVVSCFIRAGPISLYTTASSFRCLNSCSRREKEKNKRKEKEKKKKRRKKKEEKRTRREKRKEREMRKKENEMK